MTSTPRVVRLLGERLRAHDNIDVAGLLGDEFLVLLSKAACHDDLAAVLLTLPGLQVAQVAVQLVVGVLSDTARVEHHNIGFRLRFGAYETISFKEAGDPLGIVIVHLAPHGAHDVTALGVRSRVGHTARLPTQRASG